MPLSEGEQRILEQMERALHAEDPKLATALKQGNQTILNGRQFALGILVFFVGIAGLIGGVASKLVVVGAIAFLVMLGGVLIMGRAFGKSESKPGSEDGEPVAKTATKASKPDTGSFMRKMEDRWRRRNEDEDH